MCSEPRRRRSPRALALVLVALPLAAAGCGKKGDPSPAPRTIPQAIGDLTVRQRGYEVVVEMTHPKTTVSGLALPGLDAVVLYELARVAPAAPGAPILLPDRREFDAAARPLLTIAGAELASAISGDRITLRFRLPEPVPDPAPQRFFAVRTTASGGETSEPSNLVALLPRAVPQAPADLRLVARKDGIELAWPPAAADSGIAGWNVYRRAAELTGYGPALLAVAVAEASAVDRSALYGKRYIYAVTAVATRDPLFESALSVEREVAYDDRFAPVAPAGLAALPGPGEVRLVWEAVAEPDIAGYVVERAEPDSADFHRVGPESVTALEYVDRGLGSGFTFRFRVAAVDKSGNLGPFSRPVEARVP